MADLFRPTHQKKTNFLSLIVHKNILSGAPTAQIACYIMSGSVFYAMTHFECTCHIMGDSSVSGVSCVPVRGGSAFF